jgi:hypothetical protein
VDGRRSRAIQLGRDDHEAVRILLYDFASSFHVHTLTWLPTSS